MKAAPSLRRASLLFACGALLLGAGGCALFEPAPPPTREGLFRALARYERLIGERNWPALLEEAYLPFEWGDVRGLWEGVFGRWLLSHLVGARALGASWALDLKEEKRNWQEMVEGLKDFELEVLALRRGSHREGFEATYYVHYRLSLGHAKFPKPLLAEGVMEWGYHQKTGRWVRLVPVPGDGKGLPPGPVAARRE